MTEGSDKDGGGGGGEKKRWLTENSVSHRRRGKRRCEEGKI